MRSLSAESEGALAVSELFDVVDLAVVLGGALDDLDARDGAAVRQLHALTDLDVEAEVLPPSREQGGQSHGQGRDGRRERKSAGRNAGHDAPWVMGPWPMGCDAHGDGDTDCPVGLRCRW